MLIVATMTPNTTRTRLFGIFVLAGRKLTAPEVVALARPLGISATNVKSHLTRMVEEGALARSGPKRASRYGPSRRQAAIVKGIATRLASGYAERWDGKWILFAFRMPPERGARERLRTSLWFDGFRPWDSSTFVRPAWPRTWAISRARWYGRHAPELAVHGTLLRGVDTTRLYRLDAIDREARKLARWIRATRVRAISPSRAFAARIEIGGLVARLAGHDPRLPKRLWGGRGGMRELSREFEKFERRFAPAAQRFLNEVLP
jgi:DNA-binding transcriptional regulator PaaX